MTPSCWVNGAEQDQIAVSDRGLRYGDGLFETMAVRAGRIPLLDRHLARLSLGLRRLGIEGVDVARLGGDVRRRCAAADRGVARLTVTRGSSARGYQPPVVAEPNWILALSEWPQGLAASARDGVVIRLCRQRLASQPALAGIKHLNRLEQVLARAEWRDPGIAEGLMLDDAGRPVCGTMSNLFVVRDGRLLTPSVDRCGVAGVMRGLVLELAGEAGLDCSQADLSLEDALTADEMFLTNAIIGIWPVRQCAQAVFPSRSLAEVLQGRLVQAGIMS